MPQQYHPDDLKGKGEPSFTIEKALKEHKRIGDSGTEMKTRSRRAHSAGHTDAYGTTSHDHAEKSMGSAIKRRIGSIRRRKQDPEV